jgi:formyltetrahydrofolate-dependent phosphoribosylglycinamide formyltransferase
MLSALLKKWNIGKKDLVAILCVFAVTGFTTAFVSRAITGWVGFTDATDWWAKLLLRLAVLLVGYQAILLVVAFLFGQFSFFWKFEKRLLQRLRILKKENKQVLTHVNNPLMNKEANPEPKSSNKKMKLAIFASGTGTNAQKLIAYFKDSPLATVNLVVSNKKEAGVLTIAEKEGIETLLIEKDNFFRGDAYLPQLQERGISFIVLAGFLWKIPQALITAYPRRIINIHPALLPKFGGKGMYGHYVHEAVLQAGEIESGITIHYVDEHYDNGDVIFQTACPVMEGDTPETIAKRIHQLEHLHYPRVVEEVIAGPLSPP